MSDENELKAIYAATPRDEPPAHVDVRHIGTERTLDALMPFVERGVPALIAQPGQLRTNLLGMSFLNRLESWEVRGDKLQLRGHP